MVFGGGPLLHHQLTLAVEDEDRERAMEDSSLVCAKLLFSPGFPIELVHEDHALYARARA